MQIPSRCDVLIVGAGPAGTAAAHALASAGVDVLLTDQRRFPRDKVCGDGLISDALGALDELGVRERVLAEATHASELRVYAPSGRYAALRGRFACVPRRQFDALLLDSATDAGARVVTDLAATAALRAGEAVTGTRFAGDGQTIDIAARVTLLATGANATALDAFGLAASKRPTGVAGRAYYEAPADLVRAHPHLTIAYDRDWCPGYGWIFPSPPNGFNIGVGLFSGVSDTGRLREFWRVFTTRFAPAAQIAAASREVTPFRGAPLRTGLTGARFGARGLLVIGEAAAVTYPATGEGIGKAMESGLLAARLVIDALQGRRPFNTLHNDYGAEFRRRFASRYAAYAVAQRWASSPFMLNILALRANAGRFVQSELEALIDERGDAGSLFSLPGLLKALVS